MKELLSWTPTSSRSELAADISAAPFRFLSTLRSKAVVSAFAVAVLLACPISAASVDSSPIIGDRPGAHHDDDAWVQVKRFKDEYIRLENSGTTGRWYTLRYGNASVYYDTYVDVYYAPKGNTDTSTFNLVQTLRARRSVGSFDFWNGEDVDFWFRVRTNYNGSVKVWLEIRD